MVRVLHKETHGRQPGCLSFMLQILVRRSSDLYVSSSLLSSAGFRISVFTSDVCGLAPVSPPTTDLKTCICYLQYDLLYAPIRIAQLQCFQRISSAFTCFSKLRVMMLIT